MKKLFLYFLIVVEFQASFNIINVEVQKVSSALKRCECNIKGDKV